MTGRARPLTKRASSPETLPANTVRAFLDALGRLGYHTAPLLANAGLREPDLADPDARIPCSVLSQIFGTAMAEKPIRNLAASLAAETPIGAFPLVDYLAVTSETVGAALRQLTRYLRLNEAAYTVEPVWENDRVRVRFDQPLNAFAAEFGVTLTVLHLSREADGILDIRAVYFTHSPDDPAAIGRLLDCPIHPNATWNGFDLTRESADLPMRRRDHALRRVLEQHAGALAAKSPGIQCLASDVARVVASRLSEGAVQIESVARALSTSTRSLQRRLAAIGISYQQMLEKTRRDAAGEYLSNPHLSIGEVAYLLGYSEPAAFHRAFKRWNGMTPQAFRRKHAEITRTATPRSD